MMKIRFFLVFLLLIVSVLDVISQTKTGNVAAYRSPVDFPISLSGNVGEARPNHFHSGIDIRSGGAVGAPVYAVADGVVSRICVSPTGYGNALYVTHPDGAMSVYAHLDRFADRIADWVRQQQYAKERFAVDLWPVKDQFLVKRGERIAALGNSGSSGGPHLHFEIRAPRTGNPINLGKQQLFAVADNVSPLILGVYLYEQDTVLGVPIFRESDRIKISKNKAGEWELSDTVLYFDRPAYLAYEVTDRKNGSSFTMALYAMEQQVDGRVNFSYAVDEVAFATTRYVNAMTQYDRTIKTRNDVIRAYVAPNNPLHIYKEATRNDGVIVAGVGARHEIETTTWDDAGNSASVNFALLYKPRTRQATLPGPNERPVVWDRDFVVRDSVYSVRIPAKTLYESKLLPVGREGRYYIIGSPDVPMHTNATLRAEVDIPEALRSKVLFVNEKGKNAGGAWKEGALELATRVGGRFAVGYDTVAPKVERLKVAGDLVRFKVTDNLSGVASYRLTVDGAWALLEYDPKTASLIHRYKPTAAPKKRAMVVRVVDGKGNAATLKTTGQW